MQNKIPIFVLLVSFQLQVTAVLMSVTDMCACEGMNIMVDHTEDITTWFLSAQNSGPLLFNGLQLSRQNDSLLILFVTGKALLLSWSMHMGVYRYRHRDTYLTIFQNGNNV